MLKVNINDRKYFHVYFWFSQTNWRLHNSWTTFCYVFRYIYKTKAEREVVNPSKFYKRFEGDIINRRNKTQPDDLLQKINSNHPSMKYTAEVKPEIFLDIKIVYSNDVIATEVKRNERKLP